jgi:hypothetical protein
MGNNDVAPLVYKILESKFRLIKEIKINSISNSLRNRIWNTSIL